MSEEKVDYGKTLNMIDKIESYQEIETGEPVGDEIW